MKEKNKMVAIPSCMHVWW